VGLIREIGEVLLHSLFSGVFVYHLYRAAIFWLLLFCAIGVYQIVQQQRAILHVLSGGCL
jgi:hypothetical protein